MQLAKSAVIKRVGRTVRFIKSCVQRDTAGATWDVDAGDELEVPEADARRLLSDGWAVEAQPSTNRK